MKLLLKSSRKKKEILTKKSRNLKTPERRKNQFRFLIRSSGLEKGVKLNLMEVKNTPKPENPGIDNTSFVRESPSRASNGQTLRASAHGSARASTRASGRSSAVPAPKPRSSPPGKVAKMEIDENLNLNRQFC